MRKLYVVVVSVVLFGLLTISIFQIEPVRSESRNTKGQSVKVGVATILSGDFATLGENIANTVESYRRHYLRHNIEFVYEDAGKDSLGGLRAYQKLINIDRVQMLIGGTTSNGTIAAKSLINQSKTPLITPLTGGANIDQAGPYIFRLGNSDVLNGSEQAEALLTQGIRNVALYTEETEYTQDMAKFFRERFVQKGGELVYDQSFSPDKTDFRSEITVIKNRKAEALFIPTQTGLALGIFLRQLSEQGGLGLAQIHTSFVAAANPDAYKAASKAIYGVQYMAPKYEQENPKLKEFFALYRQDHGQDPAIAFHTAGTVDALNMLQDYLDTHSTFDPEDYSEYLLQNVKNYHGLMGTYSFDSEGNADTGFEPAVIK